MKIAIVQSRVVWEAKDINYAKAEVFAEKAVQADCNVIVFPEMFNTGYSMNLPLMEKDADRGAESIMSQMAKKYNINLIAGFAVKKRGESKGWNMAVAYDRSGMVLARYAKIYPFSFAGEDLYYMPGNNTVVFELEGVPCSVFICYDLRFPEIFRAVAVKVRMIFVIANWPSLRIDHWQALLKARAIENQCLIVGVNRTGSDNKGLYYPGASHVFGPLGNDICSGSETDEFMICEVDAQEVLKVRSDFPFLKDCRHIYE